MRFARRVAFPSLRLLQLLQTKEAPLNESSEIVRKPIIQLTGS
jgi:hypothetical protein